MSLGKTWFDLKEASGKFGLSKEQILTWVDDGLVRYEAENGVVVRVNGDDLTLELEAYIHPEES